MEGFTTEEITELVEKNYGYEESASKTVVLVVYQKTEKGDEEIVGSYKITP